MSSPNLPTHAQLGVRPPPQAAEHERSVLAAVLVLPTAFNLVSTFLTPDAFYRPAHRFIYEACCELKAKSQPIDVLTVSQVLRANGKLQEVGGAYYLADLTRYAFSAANVENHARVLVEMKMRREVAKLAMELTVAALDDETDAFELLDKVQAGLRTIESGVPRHTIQTAEQVMFEVLADLDKPKADPTGVRYWKTGYPELDRCIKGGGIGAAKYIVVGGYQKMGKTTFMLNIALNLARTDCKVAIFSLEMSSKHLGERILAIESGISSHALSEGNLTDDEYRNRNAAADRIARSNMYFDDEGNVNINNLISTMYHFIDKYKVDGFFVDYHQMVKYVGGTGKWSRNEPQNREREMAMISQAIQQFCRKTGKFVFDGSQYSREHEKRPGDKSEPVLSDLRESGTMAQDADLVLLLYPPYKYKHDTWYGLETHQKNAGGFLYWLQVQVCVAANRFGPCGYDLRLNFKLYPDTGKVTQYVLEGDVSYASAPRQIRNPAEAQQAEPTAPDIRDFATGESHETEDMPF